MCWFSWVFLDFPDCYSVNTLTVLWSILKLDALRSRYLFYYTCVISRISREWVLICFQSAEQQIWWLSVFLLESTVGYYQDFWSVVVSERYFDIFTNNFVNSAACVHSAQWILYRLESTFKISLFFVLMSLSHGTHTNPYSLISSLWSS